MLLRGLCTILSAFFLLMGFATGGMAADKLLQETWSLVGQGEKVIGYNVDKLWRGKDGYRMTSDLTMLIPTGNSYSRTNVRLELLASQSFHARSFSMLHDNGGARTWMTGKFSDKKVEIATVTPDGQAYGESYDLPKPVYFESTFLTHVLEQKGLKPGAIHTGTAWNIVGGGIQEYSLKVMEKTTYPYRGRKVSVFKVSEEREGGASFLLDTTGVVYYCHFPNTDLFFRKAEKDEIPELKAVAVETLIIPGNIRVGWPEFSTKSRIRIAWNGVSSGDFVVIDNRQQVVEMKNLPENNHEALLVITQDSRDFSGRVKLPVSGKEMAPYLGKTDYITPSLPEVKQLATKILGGESDGWTAAGKLAEWVYENIRGVLLPRTLTTKEILAQMQGGSAENAIIFAALARSAGLPTRIVYGVRFDGEIWASHLWNEVWLGEWVAIDPTYLQTSPDALLLKLVDSDRESGIIKLRRALTGNLEISIEEVEVPVIDEADGEEATEIINQTYTNHVFACTVTAPPGWILNETGNGEIPELEMIHPENMAQAVLFMFDMPEGMSSEVFMNNRIQSLQMSMEGFTLLEQFLATLSGLPAKVGEWTYTVEETKIRQQTWVFTDGLKGFMLIFTADEDEWELVKTDFLTIRESFTRKE